MNVKMTNDELCQDVCRILFENGPLSLTELKNKVGKVTRERLRKVLERHPDLFEVVGHLMMPGIAPQLLWGIVGLRQPLTEEPKKAHPFDLSKHSIFYRDVVKKQRIPLERY